MAQIIGVSIDLSKLDKSKIKDGKNGAKYYDLSIMVNDEPDKYGKDVSVTEPQTKEQRADKVKKVYLGNGKVVWSGEGKKNAPETEQRNNSTDISNENLPF